MRGNKKKVIQGRVINIAATLNLLISGKHILSNFPTFHGISFGLIYF